MPNPNPVEGAPSELEAQGTALFPLQAAATGNGNGQVAPTDGFNGAQMLEIQKSGSGATVGNVEGSYDGSVWYPVGYQRVDATDVPIRATTGIAVTTGTFNHVFQLLDLYPRIRLRLSGSSGVISTSAQL